jgi:hypothetical protein
MTEDVTTTRDDLVARLRKAGELEISGELASVGPDAPRRGVEDLLDITGSFVRHHDPRHCMTRRIHRLGFRAIVAVARTSPRISAFAARPTT